MVSDVLEQISEWQQRRSVEEVFERGYSASEKPAEADTALFVGAELFRNCKDEIECLRAALLIILRDANFGPECEQCARIYDKAREALDTEKAGLFE